MLHLIDGSPDYDFVTNRIATGGSISSLEQLQHLKSVGITHIINGMDEYNDALLFTPDLGISYLWNGVEDDGKSKPTEWFRKALDFALPALVLPNTKIYSHCAAGINRGPSLAYAILRAQGLPGPTAKTMLRTARPCVWIGYADAADMALEELGYV